MKLKEAGISALLVGLLLGFLFLFSKPYIPANILNYQPSFTETGNDSFYYSYYTSGGWIRYDGRITPPDNETINGIIYGLTGSVKYLKVINKGTETLGFVLKDSNGTVLYNNTMSAGTNDTVTDLNNLTYRKLYIETYFSFDTNTSTNDTVITNATGTQHIILSKPVQLSSSTATLNVTHESLAGSTVNVSINGVKLGALNASDSYTEFTFNQSILVNGTNNLSFINSGVLTPQEDYNDTGLTGANGDVIVSLVNIPETGNLTIISEFDSEEEVNVSVNRNYVGKLASGSQVFEDVEFQQGENTITFTNSGTNTNITNVSISYLWRDYGFNITQSELTYDYYVTSQKLKCNFVIIGYTG